MLVSLNTQRLIKVEIVLCIKHSVLITVFKHLFDFYCYGHVMPSNDELCRGPETGSDVCWCIIVSVSTSGGGHMIAEKQHLLSSTLRCLLKRISAVRRMLNLTLRRFRKKINIALSIDYYDSKVRIGYVRH